jgi:hypothetical protein
LQQTSRERHKRDRRENCQRQRQRQRTKDRLYGWAMKYYRIV